MRRSKQSYDDKIIGSSLFSLSDDLLDGPVLRLLGLVTLITLHCQDDRPAPSLSGGGDNTWRERESIPCQWRHQPHIGRAHGGHILHVFIFTLCKL